MVKIVCFTAASVEEAEKIVDALVAERIVACANMFPVKSKYWWKGEVEISDEVFVWMKTNAANFEKTVSRIKELHSYELPVVESFDVDTTEEIEEWVESSLRNQ